MVVHKVDAVALDRITLRAFSAVVPDGRKEPLQKKRGGLCSAEPTRFFSWFRVSRRTG
jgi:hypothetical protein